MTKDLKVKLFNFKNGLTIDQQDVAQVVEAHMGFCDQYSELEVFGSLKEKLQGQVYFPGVKALLEGLEQTYTADQLLYELKDAYRKIERKNQGQLYRHPLDVLLNVINAGDATSRMEKIVNELSIYDWVPEIKTIMWKVSTSPVDRQNYSSNGGRALSVRTIAQKVSEGHIAFIQNKWFLIKEDAIEITLLEKHIEDQTQLQKMRLLEEAVRHAEILGDRITFQLGENLVVGLSVKNPGKLFINESEAEKETTLETLFMSPLVPYVNRNFFPVIAEALQNIDKFIELDIVKRVHNPLRSNVETYAFNYGTGNYMYRVDKRAGSSLMKYESASGLIEDVLKELDYDLTPFYENKVSKEVKIKRSLEDAEKVITEQIAEINEGLITLDLVDADIANDAGVVEARAGLLEQAKTLRSQLEDVRLIKNDLMSREYANATPLADSKTAVVESDGTTTATSAYITMLTQDIYSSALKDPNFNRALEDAKRTGEIEEAIEIAADYSNPDSATCEPRLKGLFAQHMAAIGAETYDDMLNAEVDGNDSIYTQLDDIIYQVTSGSSMGFNESAKASARKGRARKALRKRLGEIVIGESLNNLTTAAYPALHADIKDSIDLLMASMKAIGFTDVVPDTVRGGGYVDGTHKGKKYRFTFAYEGSEYKGEYGYDVEITGIRQGDRDIMAGKAPYLISGLVGTGEQVEVAHMIEEKAFSVVTAAQITELANDIYHNALGLRKFDDALESAKRSGDVDLAVELAVTMADPSAETCSPDLKEKIQSYMSTLGSASYDEFANDEVVGGDSIYTHLEETIFQVTSGSSMGFNESAKLSRKEARKAKKA